MSLRTVRPLRSAALACAVALAACNTGSLTVGTVGSGSTASVRFANATANTLDLAGGGVVDAATTNIAPGASVGCLLVDPTATPVMTTRVSGSATDIKGFPGTFAGNGRYTVVAYVGSAGTIQFLSIPLTFAPSAARSGLRVMNASFGLGSVDVYVTLPGAVLGTPVFSSLPVGVVSSTFDLTAGSTQIRLTTAGTTNVVFDAGTQVLGAGNSYTLVVSSATPTALLVPDC